MYHSMCRFCIASAVTFIFTLISQARAHNEPSLFFYFLAKLRVFATNTLDLFFPVPGG